MTLQESIAEYIRLRAYSPGDHELPDHRLKVAYVLAALSDHVAEAQYRVEFIKLKREEAKLKHMGSMTGMRADAAAKVEHGHKLIEAERELSRLKYLISSGREILNAIASKLKSLEMEARNQH